MSEGRIYPEPMVARVTGIKRPALKRARMSALEKGPDWWLAESVVTYGEDGLKKLLVALGLDAADLAWEEPLAVSSPLPESESAASADADPTQAAPCGPVEPLEPVVEKIAAAVPVARALLDLTVRKVAWNPTIVMAWHEAEAREVRVRVRNNVNFRPGMVLRARAPEQADGLWCMEGNCPRWPGRY